MDAALAKFGAVGTMTMNMVERPWLITIALTSPNFPASLGERKTATAVRTPETANAGPLIESATPYAFENQFVINGTKSPAPAAISTLQNVNLMSTFADLAGKILHLRGRWSPTMVLGGSVIFN